MLDKIKGIKKAVGEFNYWDIARIYYNQKTNQVWTCYYTDGNSWNVYHDSNIFEVYNKLWIYERGEKITMKQLKKEIEKTIQAREEY